MMEMAAEGIIDVNRRDIRIKERATLQNLI